MVGQLFRLSLATLYTAIEAAKADSMANVSKGTAPTTSMWSLGIYRLKLLGSVGEGCGVPSVPFHPRNEPMAPINSSRQIAEYFFFKPSITFVGVSRVRIEHRG